VPTGIWAPEEFENLLANDQDEVGGAAFGCHRHRNKPPGERHVCAGWLLDQRRRNYPSIRLRVALLREKVTRDQLDEITDGGHELYPSIMDMCLANGVRTARDR
jgi:hypothetical protein